MHPLVKRMRRFSVSDETLPYLVDFLQDDPNTYDFGVALFEVLNDYEIPNGDLHLLWCCLIQDSYIIINKNNKPCFELSDLAAQITWKKNKAESIFTVFQFFQSECDEEYVMERLTQLPDSEPELGRYATRLCLYHGAPVSWTKEQIQRSGDCVSALDLFLSEKVQFNWTKKLIEKEKSAYGAYQLYLNHGMPRSWAERIIEQAESGDPSYIAFLMYKQESSLSWAKGVIEKAKSGDPSFAAYMLYMQNKRIKKWVMKVIKNDKIGEPETARKLIERNQMWTNW